VEREIEEDKERTQRRKRKDEMRKECKEKEVTE
jgi:hypothetical protein